MEQISKISDVLFKAVFEGGEYSNSIKKATAFGFWKDICGSKFSSFSAPYEIKDKTLLVAVKSPQVMQELMFNKEKLLSKIHDYFLPLNIKINDIKYDYKVWNKVTANRTIAGDESLSYYSEDEIKDVELSKIEKEELSKVTNTISGMNFLSEDLKNKYLKNVINSIKVKKMREYEGI